MRGPHRLRLGIGALVLAIEVATAVAPRAQAQSLINDYPVPGGWFYSQEGRTPHDVPPFRGYTVVDDADASFWTEFRRYGGVEVLGYPVSRRYHYPTDAGFVSQAFQRGILQWHPDDGRAEVANVFEQFSEQGLDDQLEIAGIPRALPSSSLPFGDDAALRMGWVTEPRFLARYLFDPVYQVPFEAQEQAWAAFGLPQTFPERPVYYREKANGKFGAPLYLPYVAQRFQKAGLELFLDNVALDPTIVPGDGKVGCIAITAAGRLARRLGAGKLLPSVATQPEPLENPPHVHFVPSVPPATSENQSTIQFELVGTGFDPGEPVTIRLTPVPNPNQLSTPLPTLVSRVDHADSDGSFDQLVTARVATYNVTLTGETSHKTLDASQDPLLNLAQPTGDFTAAASRATYC
jgi:LGFP repeat